MKISINQTTLLPVLALSLTFSLALGASVASAADRRVTTDRYNDRQVATERFTEYADVIDVQPVYKNARTRQPRQECWTETQTKIIGYEAPRYGRYQSNERRQSNSNSTIVGGLVGGVIGNQIARGRNSGSRTGATIAGAIIGGAVGSNASSNYTRDRRVRNQSVQRRRAPIYESYEVQRCKDVPLSRVEQRIQHYDVTYRYKGRTFQTRTRRDPGRQIELQVSVAPARQ